MFTEVRNILIFLKSLTIHLFSESDSSKDNIIVTPLVKKKRFVPKRCSFGSNVQVSAYSNNDFKTPESAQRARGTPKSARRTRSSSFSERGSHGNMSVGNSNHGNSLSNHGNVSASSNTLLRRRSFSDQCNTSRPELLCEDKINCSCVDHYHDEDDNEISFGLIDSKTFARVKKCSDVDLISERSPISGVIGTPDYIAPELLLRRAHTASADWWSFGICLYEFITGIPPFTDVSIGNIFKNILNMEVEWPEDCSEGVKDLIVSLLQYEPENRLQFKEVKNHVFFNEVPWDNILEIEMPFVPCPENETDTGYFDGHNDAMNIKLSDFDGGHFMNDDDSGVFSKNV